jgi:hypothetical protein
MISRAILAGILAIHLTVWSAVASPGIALAGGEHRVIVGLATTCANITTWWHGDPTGNSSLDLVKCSGATSYSEVYWQSYHYSGVSMYLEVVPYTGICTGVRIRSYRSEYPYSSLGDYWYTHVAPYVTVGTSWFAQANFGWTIRALGFVTPSENQNCLNAGLWYGPHLHQGGDNSWWTAIYRNTAIPNPVNPTGNHGANWVNRFLW